jgi:hypothetical protein
MKIQQKILVIDIETLEEMCAHFFRKGQTQRVHRPAEFQKNELNSDFHTYLDDKLKSHSIACFDLNYKVIKE